MTLVRKTRWITLTAALLCAGVSCFAQAHRPPVAAPSTVPAVLLSDLHFDPYFDPGKFDQLRSTPAAGWQAIFAAPASPTQASEFLRVNTACKLTRGVDSSWPWLEASLAAVRAASPHALFVAVSGDLVAHEFDCRYRVLSPKATAAEITAFTEKTEAYVAMELHRTFGPTPVYLTMGNNDTACGDYRENPNSEFLRAVADGVAEDAEQPAAGRKAVTEAFAASGDYSVALPAPIARGRLIVLQDMFQARTYAGCNGKPNEPATAAQIEWLRAELLHARERSEHVWIMAHIPPGVDVYNTLTKKRDICAGEVPVMFLANDKMVDVLEEFSDVVRLAIFAHTHLDEMKLLRGKVAAKLVPSISPINGNNPAFTLADIDPYTAMLKDYRVIASSNQAGAKWAEEYRYSAIYQSKEYGPRELETTLNGFVADREGIQQHSTDYQQNAFTGGGKGSIGIHLVWPAYACSLANDTAAGYRACFCSQTPAKP